MKIYCAVKVTPEYLKKVVKRLESEGYRSDPSILNKQQASYSSRNIYHLAKGNRLYILVSSQEGWALCTIDGNSFDVEWDWSGSWEEMHYYFDDLDEDDDDYGWRTFDSIEDLSKFTEDWFFYFSFPE